MRTYTMSSRWGLITLIVSYCLLWNLSASAQLAIGSDGLFMKSGTPFSVDRLELSPVADTTFSTNLLKRSATDLIYNGTQSIQQVYTFTTPVDYQGTIRIYYEASALNGIAATELMLVYAATENGPLTALAGSVVNNIAGFVEYEFVASTRIQQVTAVSSLALPAITPDANGIIYVKETSNGTGTGDSWVNATNNLQEAINAPGVKEVWVAAGTYIALINSFKMKNNVAIYGGFSGAENSTMADRDWETNPTILSGDDQRRVVANDFTESDPLTSSAVLDGFTLTKGKSYSRGGGMFNYYSSPIITNVTISGNNVEDPSNTNTNPHGGGGGGMANSYYSSPILTNVIISGNMISASRSRSFVYGGGMFNDSDSSPTLINVTISGNSLVKRSDGTVSGGGIHNQYSSALLFNTIVWGNDGSSISGDGIDQSSSNNLINGGDGSNISGIPTGLTAADIFMDPKATSSAPTSTGDYRLKAASLAINAGNNSYYTDADKGNRDLTTDLDLAGNPRLSGCDIDLGAYEVQGQVCITPDADNILYVKKGGTGDFSGKDWANAIPELADALKWANDHNVNWEAPNAPLKINVAKGMYKPKHKAAEIDSDGVPTTDQDKTFLLVKNVQLYGGFDPDQGNTDINTRIIPSLTDPSPANGTVLSGDFNDDDNNNDFNKHIENIYHVVLSAGDVDKALLDGFTIQGGNATSDAVGIIVNEQYIRRFNGGGMHNYESSPTITNVTISGNMSEAHGGGMYNYSSSSPILTNVTISGNKAGNFGGGMCNGSSSFPTITNALISGNTSNMGGGGMDNDSSSPILTNVTVSGNTSNMQGGGMNNTDSSPKLFNSIVWGNGTSNVTGQIESSSRQNLIENGDPSYTIGQIPANLKAVDIFLAPQDPSLAPTTAGDYRLKVGSLAINAGNNSYFTDLDAQSKDLLGNARLQGGSIDLGAYESSYEDIASLSSLTPIPVAYGTELADITTIPTDITVTLTGSGGEVDVLLDANTANWTLVLTNPTGLTSYDPIVAGSYTFEVPVLPPDPTETPWFTNTQSLKASLEITIEKGTPALKASWNGVDIIAADGLGLIYWEKGILDIPHDNTDGDAELGFSFVSGDGVLNLGDLSAVQAMMSSFGRLAISLPETDNFQAAAFEFEVRVAKKDLILTALDQSKVYGQAFSFAGTEYSVVGLEEMDEITSVSLKSGGETETAAVGNHALVITDARGSGLGNYEIVYENASFTVSPLAITVTSNALSKTYGENDPVLTYSVLPSLVAGDAFTGVLERDPGEDVGTYAIGQGDLSAGTNYDLTFVGADFVIEKATITGVTFDDAGFVYDGQVHSLVVSGLPTGATVNYVNNDKIEAGEYTVTATVSQVNYSDEVLTAKLTINQASATITTDAVQRYIYDGVLKNVVASLNHAETALEYSPRQGYAEVGTYPIVISSKETDNYEAVSTSVTLQILPATMGGLTFHNAGYSYDGRVHSLSVDNLPVDATVVYTNNNKTEAGVYTVTATVSRINYDDQTVTAVLTINKAAAEITADAVQRHVYDGVLKNVTASLNHAETALEYSPQQGYAEAGTYDITISSKETANYLAAKQTVRLIVEKGGFGNLVLKSKTVTFNGKTHSLEFENLPQGSTVSYENNVHTDAGTYMVTARATHPNFQEKTLTASLTITKAQQQISFVEIGTVSRDASRVTLNVNASSGLLVTVTGDDNLVATVSGGELLIHRLGTLRLTATQEGDKNHEAAAPVSITVRIADAGDDGPVRVHQALSPNGDGINDFLIIEGIKDYPDNKLIVFTRNGLRIFTMTGYDNESRVFKGIGDFNSSGGTLPQGTYFYVLEYRDKGERKVKKGWFVLKM